METGKCNTRKSTTEPLPWIRETPREALWNQEELKKEQLKKEHQHVWFERTSGPGIDDYEDEEDLAEKDTIVSPAIQIVQPLPDETEAIAALLEEDSGRFVGISLTTVALFRSGIQQYRDKHSGAFPEYLHASRKRCKDYKEEMVHMFYGKDFDGRLPLSYTRYGNKAVRIIPDDSLDDYTVICSVESVDDTPTL